MPVQQSWFDGKQQQQQQQQKVTLAVTEEGKETPIPVLAGWFGEEGKNKAKKMPTTSAEVNNNGTKNEFETRDEERSLTLFQKMGVEEEAPLPPPPPPPPAITVAAEKPPLSPPPPTEADPPPPPIPTLSVKESVSHFQKKDEEAASFSSSSRTEAAFRTEAEAAEAMRGRVSKGRRAYQVGK